MTRQRRSTTRTTNRSHENVIPQSRSRASWLVVPALAIATFAAYQPAWRGQPLWDDAAHMTRAALRSPDGLARIWLDLGATQQYYPLTHTVFWIEHALWGDATLGYHLVNIALHLMTALLLLGALRMQGIKGAAFAAAVFALHPVHVESVAWITELKNTLAGVFFMGAAWAYLSFDVTRRRRTYGIALTVFALGLLAKTVVATLPAVLLAVLWWRRGRFSWRRDLVPLAPFFASGLLAGLGTAWVERHYVIGGLGMHFGLGPAERVLLAGRATWFYLGKLVWPVNLMFFYPRWEISRDVWWLYLFPLGALGLLVGLWTLRARSRAPLAALLVFVAALLPALGFVDVFPFRYSYVADHFQYLASLGVIVFVCAVGASWMERQRGWRRLAGNAACLVVLAALAILTWRQTRLYTDSETLYRATLERNPRCWLALNNLGMISLAKQDYDEAERLFFESARLNPGYEAAQNNCGFVLARRGRVDEAIAHYRRALDIWPEYADAHVNLGNALFSQGKFDDAIEHYAHALRSRPDLLEPHNNMAFALLAKGRPKEAIAQFDQALRVSPSSTTALVGLARTLAVSEDPGVRNGALAVELAERATRLSERRDPAVLDVLAAAYAEAGRFDEGVAAAEAALDLARRTNRSGLASELEARLRLYRAGLPFHETRR
jgi:tetratricopeptide (TPR) repeat protein